MRWNALRFASWLDVHEAEALNILAAMDLQQSRFEEARLVQERAVRRQPDEPRQYLILSDILQRMNRMADASRARARSEQLQTLAHATVALKISIAAFPRLGCAAKCASSCSGPERSAVFMARS